MLNLNQIPDIILSRIALGASLITSGQALTNKAVQTIQRMSVQQAFAEWEKVGSYDMPESFEVFSILMDSAKDSAEQQRTDALSLCARLEECVVVSGNLSIASSEAQITEPLSLRDQVLFISWFCRRHFKDVVVQTKMMIDGQKYIVSANGTHGGVSVYIVVQRMDGTLDYGNAEQLFKIANSYWLR